MRSQVYIAVVKLHLKLLTEGCSCTESFHAVEQAGAVELAVNDAGFQQTDYKAAGDDGTDYSASYLYSAADYTFALDVPESQKAEISSDVEDHGTGEGVDSLASEGLFEASNKNFAGTLLIWLIIICNQ